ILLIATRCGAVQHDHTKRLHLGSDRKGSAAVPASRPPRPTPHSVSASSPIRRWGAKPILPRSNVASEPFAHLPERVGGRRRISLLTGTGVCSCYVHARRGPSPCPNPRTRLSAVRHGHPQPPRPRPQPRPQAHRLRRATPP